jgi:hypothetical protein
LIMISSQLQPVCGLRDVSSCFAVMQNDLLLCSSPSWRQTRRAHHVGTVCRRKCSILRSCGAFAWGTDAMEDFSSKAALSWTPANRKVNCRFLSSLDSRSKEYRSPRHKE